MAEIFTPVVLASTASDWGPVHIAAGPTGVVAAGMLATEEAIEADLVRRGFRRVVALADADDGPARSLARRATII